MSMEAKAAILLGRYTMLTTSVEHLEALFHTLAQALYAGELGSEEETTEFANGLFFVRLGKYHCEQLHEELTNVKAIAERWEQLERATASRKEG